MNIKQQLLPLPVVTGLSSGPVARAVSLDVSRHVGERAEAEGRGTKGTKQISGNLPTKKKQLHGGKRSVPHREPRGHDTWRSTQKWPV